MPGHCLEQLTPNREAAGKADSFRFAAGLITIEPSARFLMIYGSGDSSMPMTMNFLRKFA
jgi:hypothetical protein